LMAEVSIFQVDEPLTAFKVGGHNAPVGFVVRVRGNAGFG